MINQHEQLAFGQRLAALRQRLLLTQAQLAERAGLSLAIVSKLEIGASANPRLLTIKRLAKVLRVPAAALIEDDAVAVTPDVLSRPREQDGVGSKS